jgi:hypothetical protein
LSCKIKEKTDPAKSKVWYKINANGCNKSGSATVQEPSIISVSAKAKTSVSCNGGSNGAVNITVTGGSPIGSPIIRRKIHSPV